MCVSHQFDQSALVSFCQLFLGTVTLECMLQLGAANGQNSFNYWGAVLFSYLSAPTSDNYTFYVQSDNGAKVWVDGNVVIDDSGIWPD